MGVIEIIRKQLLGEGVSIKGKKLIKIDEDTLRVHSPSRKNSPARSIDIRYDKGSDTYSVQKHIIGKDFKIKSSKPMKGVYFDSLPNFFNKKLIKRERK